MNEKVFVSKPKAFTMIGTILFGFGFVYMLTAIGETDFNSVREAVTGGFISMIISIGLIYLGSRKRTIKVTQEKVEYISGKLIYSAKWEEIEMISAEGEKNKSTITIYIMKSEEDIFYLSTAFYSYFTLKEAFISITEMLKQKNPEAEINDEAGWLSSGATSPNTP